MSYTDNRSYYEPSRGYGKEEGILGQVCVQTAGAQDSGKEASWIIRRAQEFEEGLNGVRLRRVSSTYVGEYLDELGRNRH